VPYLAWKSKRRLGDGPLPMPDWRSLFERLPRRKVSS